jgi:preprotein translocase subunit SecB
VSTSSASPPTSFEVRLLSGPHLKEVDIQRTEDIPPEEYPISMQFGMALARMGREILGVELELRVPDVPGLKVRVVYRAVFEVVQAPEDEDALERQLRVLVTRTAPVFLFPFFRETVASIAQKTGQSLMLPMVNFNSVFDPAKAIIPEFDPKDEKAARAAR